MYRIYLYITFLFVAACGEKLAEKTIHQDEQMPAFNILLPDSVSYNTKSILAGKPSVLLYFSPHCPYSRAQITEITKNINLVKDIQFYIFTPTSFSDMRFFYLKNKLGKYKNVTVGLDNSNYFARYFKAKGFPMLAIYSEEKKLNGLFLGQMPLEQLKKVANDK
jgi:thioredoxin-related protein